jgi:predicted amidohydrolase
MKNELNIVGIQADLFWENPTKNLAFFEEKIERLPENTDLVVLPEMFTTGFTMNPENVAEKMDGNSVSWMLKIAQEKKIAITGSLVIIDGKNYYNRLVFVHPSGKIETYNKRHSFTLAGEHKAYTSGKKIAIITYKGWRICPLICYDLRFPVWARNKSKYDLLIFMANWPVKRINAWDILLKARAIENMSYTIGVNRIGEDANMYDYSGHSAIIDSLGLEMSSLAANEPGIITAVINKKNQDAIRNKLGFLNDMDTFNIEI